MGNWSLSYTNRTGELAQEPVYALVIFEDRTRLGLTSGAAVIEGDVYDSMTLRDTPDVRTFMLYDADGFELDTGHYDSATNQITVEQYGAFGTASRPFSPSKTTIGAVWMTFSSDAIPTAAELFQAGMDLPSGAQQELDLIEGYTRSEPVTVAVQDTNARITREMTNRTTIGRTAMILGGYRGLPFREFTTLHTGPITRMTVVRGSVYEFEIDTVMVKLKRKLFRDVESFSTTLSGSMTSGQTTIPLTSTAGVYDSEPTAIGEAPGQPHTITTAFTAAMYFKVGSEYMRHSGGTSPPNVIRGVLGSTAASKSGGAAVDMLFVIEGNPINILLGLLLTRDPGYQPLFLSNPPYGHLDFWNTVDDNKSALGMHMDVGDLDIDSFRTIRDQWYPRYYGRASFSKQADMEKVIRESFLKPLGLNLYVTRAGKLGLTILRPPLTADPPTIDASSVVGVPDIDFTSEEIVNEVLVEYDYDYVSGEPVSSTTVIDATSQSTYDRAGDSTIEPTWLRSDMRGESLSQRLAKKKMRHHREPNPTIPVDVLLTQVRHDIGSIVRLSAPSLPDPNAGRVGWDKLCVAVGRRVDWQTGALTLDLVDTAYHGRRFFFVSPSGTADYGSATDDEKAVYGWMADGATDKMSDNTIAYQVM